MMDVDTMPSSIHLVGKQSEIFQSPAAASVDGDCAVTIVTNKSQLNLVAESTEMLTVWLVSRVMLKHVI